MDRTTTEPTQAACRESPRIGSTTTGAMPSLTLLPLSFPDLFAPLSLLSMPGSVSGAPNTRATSPGERVGSDPASDIVAAAAAILDEEMARGIVSARNASASPREAAPGQPWLRQIHDLLDAAARAWPGLQQSVSGATGSAPTCGSAGGLVELTPASVRPGQSTTVSLSLCNKEARVVRLKLVATDLVSDTGARLPAHLLDFSPGEATLETDAQRLVQIGVAVPTGTAAGRYVGLIVVGGVDDLHALITITVL